MPTYWSGNTVVGTSEGQTSSGQEINYVPVGSPTAPQQVAPGVTVRKDDLGNTILTQDYSKQGGGIYVVPIAGYTGGYSGSGFRQQGAQALAQPGMREPIMREPILQQAVAQHLDFGTLSMPPESGIRSGGDYLAAMEAYRQAQFQQAQPPGYEAPRPDYGEYKSYRQRELLGGNQFQTPAQRNFDNYLRGKYQKQPPQRAFADPYAQGLFDITKGGMGAIDTYLTLPRTEQPQLDVLIGGTELVVKGVASMPLLPGVVALMGKKWVENPYQIPGDIAGGAGFASESIQRNPWETGVALVLGMGAGKVVGKIPKVGLTEMFGKAPEKGNIIDVVGKRGSAVETPKNPVWVKGQGWIGGNEPVVTSKAMDLSPYPTVINQKWVKGVGWTGGTAVISATAARATPSQTDINKAYDVARDYAATNPQVGEVVPPHSPVKVRTDMGLRGAQEMAVDIAKNLETLTGKGYDVKGTTIEAGAEPVLSVEYFNQPKAEAPLRFTKEFGGDNLKGMDSLSVDMRKASRSIGGDTSFLGRFFGENMADANLFGYSDYKPGTPVANISPRIIENFEATFGKSRGQVIKKQKSFGSQKDIPLRDYSKYSLTERLFGETKAVRTDVLPEDVYLRFDELYLVKEPAGIEPGTTTPKGKGESTLVKMFGRKKSTLPAISGERAVSFAKDLPEPGAEVFYSEKYPNSLFVKMGAKKLESLRPEAKNPLIGEKGTGYFGSFAKTREGKTLRVVHKGAPYREPGKIPYESAELLDLQKVQFEPMPANEPKLLSHMNADIEAQVLGRRPTGIRTKVSSVGGKKQRAEISKEKYPELMEPKPGKAINLPGMEILDMPSTGTGTIFSKPIHIKTFAEVYQKPERGNFLAEISKSGRYGTMTIQRQQLKTKEKTRKVQVLDVLNAPKMSPLPTALDIGAIGATKKQYPDPISKQLNEQILGRKQAKISRTVPGSKAKTGLSVAVFQVPNSMTGTYTDSALKPATKTKIKSMQAPETAPFTLPDTGSQLNQMFKMTQPSINLKEWGRKVPPPIKLGYDERRPRKAKPKEGGGFFHTFRASPIMSATFGLSKLMKAGKKKGKGRRRL